MLTKFLNMSQKQLDTLAEKWRRAERVKLWKSKDRSDSVGASLFYLEMTDGYLADLDIIARSKTKEYMKNMSFNGLRVLDFGAGTGEYGLYASKHGAKSVDFYDLPTKANEFLKWRIKDGNYKNCNVLDDANDFKEYDVIICVDVLEHLYNPVNTFKLLHSKLGKFGIMIFDSPLLRPLDNPEVDNKQLVDNEHIEGAVNDWMGNNMNDWFVGNYVRDLKNPHKYTKSDITVFMLYNYSEGTTGDFIERAMRNYAHVLTNRDFPIKPNGEGLRTVIQKYKIDYLLQVDSGGWYRVPKSLPCIKAAYSIDTFVRPAEIKDSLKNYDVKMYAQKRFAEKEGEHWIPLGVDIEVYKPIMCDKVHDVGFCGTFIVRRSQAARNKCLKALINEDYKNLLNVYIGRDYNDMAGLKYNQSYIVFNMGIQNDVNMRFFEAAATLTPQTYNDVDGLKELGFLPDEHYIPFKNESDIVPEIYRALNDKDRMKKIQGKAFKEVIGKHTYKHRVLKMLEIFEAEKKKLTNKE